MGYLDAGGLSYLWGKVIGALGGKQDALTPDESIAMEGGGISVTTPVRGVMTQEEFDALPEERRNRGLYIVLDRPLPEAYEWWSPHMESNALPAPYVAAASSIYYAASDAYHAFDGNTGTWWHESGSNTSSAQWISFDFGRETYVGGIRLYRRPTAHALKDLPYSFKIQGKNGSEDWVTILDVEDAPDVTDASIPREHMFADPVCFRIYRLFDLKGSQGYRSIAELEFYKEVRL